MGRIYKSRAWYERQDRKYDCQTIGILIALFALILAVPVILLLGVLL